eukprot:gene13015-14355_t
MADIIKAMNERDLSKNMTEGIIYISKIPPFMKPGKLRNLMAQFGEVGRLFLQPEDPLVRKRRKKSGGSGRKTFTEGWVEFKDKRIAKSVASSLNGTIIGGKKRSYYHDDMWNIKYLRKFKWGHISEKLVAAPQSFNEEEFVTNVDHTDEFDKPSATNIEKNTDKAISNDGLKLFLQENLYMSHDILTEQEEMLV